MQTFLDNIAFLEANTDLKDEIDKGLFSISEYFDKYGLSEVENGSRKFHKDYQPFNEVIYLEKFPDIKSAIDEGLFTSAFDHFSTYGYQEIIEKSRTYPHEKEDIQIEVDEISVKDFNSEKYKEIVAAAFDSDFYLLQRRDVFEENIDPLEHYLSYGWKERYDPNPLFSVSYYLEHNPNIVDEGYEPFYHWLIIGREEGYLSSLSLYPAKSMTSAEKFVSQYFDIAYYWEKYPDVKKAKLNPIIHYMRGGWKEGRNPTKEFNTITYILNNLDVLTSGYNPYYYYLKFKKNERSHYSEIDTVKKILSHKIYHAMQDITFPNILTNAEKIFLIVIPEHNEMSGGIFSMFSIANIVKRLKSQHGYEVVLMTRQNPDDTTYCRQKNFPNTEDVFRLEQIVRCQNAKEIYLHIPEYATKDFIENLNEEVFDYFASRENLHINILNQNIELMPEKEKYQELKKLTSNLSQSVAHHSYFGQSFADKYDLPTLLVPAYTDLSAYNPSTFEEKEDLIIYSLDDAPHKEHVLKMIHDHLPHYELIEIRNITFDYFMELATKCKFSLSFGEGLDGYVAQPIYQGGIGITVYNEEFFPSDDFLQYENFFSDEDDMKKNIISLIEGLEQNAEKYTTLNKRLLSEWDKLYSFDDYVIQIKKLINREFELFPGTYSESFPSNGFKLGLSSQMTK